MNSRDIKNFLDDVYNSFVLRDLTYFFGGNIILLTAYYSFCVSGGKSFVETLKETLLFLAGANGYTLLFLVISCYFIGLVASDFFTNLPFIRMDPKKYEKEYYSTMQKIETRLSPSLMKKFDRFTFFEVAEFTIAGSVAVSFLIIVAALIFGPLTFDRALTLLITYFIIFCMALFSAATLVKAEGGMLDDVMKNLPKMDTTLPGNEKAGENPE